MYRKSMAEETFVRYASPNERRTIIRENLGYYNSVSVGAVYDFCNQQIDLGNPCSFYGALQSCIQEHPSLSVVIKAQETDQPYCERANTADLEAHVIIGDELRVAGPNSLDETRALEAVLTSCVDASWLQESDKPPWRILVYPLVLSPTQKSPRCFIAFSYSHGLGDGMSGIAFHRTFLKAMQPMKHTSAVSKIFKIPMQTTTPAFDTAERLPISWGYLLRPILAVMLPYSIANLFGFRAAASTVDEGTWLGQRIFFEPEHSSTQIKLLEIDNSTLWKVLSTCKRNGTKFTGLLHQVVIRALSKTIPESEATNFAGVTAVNMRASIDVSQNEMGLYVTAHYAQLPREHGSGDLADISWRAARSMTEEFAESAVNLTNQPIGLLRYAPSRLI
ncbi:hypothetical protein PFICI_02090 [Pestalotiopsis fici W106-1]|uniref:Uncharacterized protein n=1 Tax=Pestalotiopsis fici (strain W106-1 / CGMCC3.15140) TaxID=1229662 RepID=W3XRX8_PESFW|nr:uncharacterized protein PFICI_02090 [Pestalotiopsis fici W106-1]ETS88262.1 hypothetical protein PFICI_02090 [Pestalotiopsis fici W106-1]